MQKHFLKSRLGGRSEAECRLLIKRVPFYRNAFKNAGKPNFMPTLLLQNNANYSPIRYVREDLADVVKGLLPRYNLAHVLGIQGYEPGTIPDKIYFDFSHSYGNHANRSVVLVPADNPKDGRITGSLDDEQCMLGLENAVRILPLDIPEINSFLHHLKFSAEHYQRIKSTPDEKLSVIEKAERRNYQKSALIMLQLYKGLTGEKAEDLKQLIDQSQFLKRRYLLEKLLSQN